jgi:PLP dependent protein
MNDLAGRLEQVRMRIDRAAERSGRPASDVLLVAVSKTVPLEWIVEAYRLGQRDFGENRVQEFRSKRESLSSMGSLPEARWHLVGQLQSNKAKLAVDLFDIIESVDSLRLARLLSRQAETLGRRLPVLLQVDYSAQPQRAGFEPETLESESVGELVALPGLDIQGLMTVAPLGLDEVELRSVFSRLRILRDSLAASCPSVEWRHLSMGMTDDFEAAVEEGSTVVRVGRALFGERPRPLSAPA